jgi:hypothetical protein
MSKYQYQISIARYGGLYYNYIVWDRILQLLGVGKHYVPEWRIGRIYVPSDVKFAPSTRYSLTDGWKQNFTTNTFWRLIKKTEKMITFSPILCIHDDDVENGEKILQIHRNYRFADENPSRNPIGEKINLKHIPQIPEGFGLYEERNYYYMRHGDETDRTFKSRTKNNFFRKKKKTSLTFHQYSKKRLNVNLLLKLK